MKHRYPLIGLCVLAVAFFGYKTMNFLKDFPHAYYHFLYGPYSCGADTLTIEENIKYNYIEGVTQNDYHMTFRQHEYSKSNDQFNVIAIHAPETGMANWDSYTVAANTAITSKEAQDFARCFESHQQEIYAAMKTNQKTFESMNDPPVPPLVGVAFSMKK